MPDQNSFFTKQINPILQAVVILAVNVAIVLIGKMLGLDAEDKFGKIFPWSMAASSLLFFVIFNSALSFSYQQQNKYWMYSIFSFAGLMLVGGYFSYLVSGLSIYEAKSMRTIYIIFTIGYIVLLSIVRSMRGILQIVLKQDKKLRGEE